MGNCSGSARSLSREELAQHKQIEKDLREEKKNYAKEVKLLLLGAGDSGKSTLVRQMKILYQDGFTLNERNLFKEIIQANVYNSVFVILTYAERIGLHLAEGNKEAAEKFRERAMRINFEPLDEESLRWLQALWADPAVVEVVSAQSKELPLSFDSVPYFLSKIEDICSAEYKPTDEDILRCRGKTSGVVETTFDVNGTPFRVVDVGGQRSERRKWIHCFQNVTSIIFFVALSEYDLKLVEDNNVYRIHESQKLFGEICSCRWFQNMDIILFLNKTDLFKEKLEHSPFSQAFPEYTGKNTYEECCKHIRKRFQALFDKTISERKKKLFIHETCSIDTSNISFVFGSVRSTILDSSLRQSGF